MCLSKSWISGGRKIGGYTAVRPGRRVSQRSSGVFRCAAIAEVAMAGCLTEQCRWLAVLPSLPPMADKAVERSQRVVVSRERLFLLLSSDAAVVTVGRSPVGADLKASS